MPYAFVSGIPASGKSYLAHAVANDLGIACIHLDCCRAEMLKIPDLEPWVSFFWNKDEKEYWESTDCRGHWENLIQQSEHMWPFLLDRMNLVRKDNCSAIFECVNILPHLAARHLDFKGIYLLGESQDVIFNRLRQVPRWGNAEDMQRREANVFFNCEGPRYKEEAAAYGFMSFNDNDAAREFLRRMLL